MFFFVVGDGSGRAERAGVGVEKKKLDVIEMGNTKMLVATKSIGPY